MLDPRIVFGELTRLITPDLATSYGVTYPTNPARSRLMLALQVSTGEPIEAFESVAQPLDRSDDR